MYRTPAAEIIPPSFCHITFFHGTSHLPSGSGNDCMHDCSHWVNHQWGWLEIYSFLQTPRACGQLSTCGFFPRVAHTAVHPGKYPVWRDHSTGAGRLSATERTHNSKQTYSTLEVEQKNTRIYTGTYDIFVSTYSYETGVIGDASSIPVWALSIESWRMWRRPRGRWLSSLSGF